MSDHKNTHVYSVPDEELEKLLTIIREVARGNYSYDIMELTKEGHSELTQKLSEEIGLMMVKLETREFKLNQVIDELRKTQKQLKRNVVQTVITIANTLGARDEYTKNHAVRVGMYSKRLATKLGLPEDDIEKIDIGGRLHDIGKIGFSDKIFNNEDTNLTRDMFNEIRNHPKIGAEILENLDFLEHIVDYVKCHHERLDGSGYPLGLLQEEIPLGARIISIADCFDAITTDRSYQKGRTVEEAFEIMKKMAGKSLDAELVDTFIEEIKANGPIKNSCE
jgi:putative nucleotidyltransferase with HDIG domain